MGFEHASWRMAVTRWLQTVAMPYRGAGALRDPGLVGQSRGLGHRALSQPLQRRGSLTGAAGRARRGADSVRHAPLELTMQQSRR